MILQSIFLRYIVTFVRNYRVNMRRKIALAILLLNLTVCAEAQIIFGGNIGISTSSGSDSRIGIVIAPEIGYSFSPNFTVGGILSYGSLQNTFGITPYLRGYFVNIQDFLRIFLSVQAPCRFAPGYQSYGAYARPGASVRIGQNVWLVAHIGAFGYSYVKSQGSSYGGWSAKVNFNTINIGFCFAI